MQRSGRNNPCPSCGRVSDGDCAWSDDVIFCHAGSNHGPDPSLKIGDTVFIDGKPWALVKTGAGYSGAAHVFKPHQDRDWKADKGVNRREILDNRAKRSLAALSIERFFNACLNSWQIKDFHSLNAYQLQQAIETIEGAHEMGIELSRSVQTIWRQHHDLRDLHKDRFNAYIKQIKTERDDLNHFRKHYLGEVI